MSEHDQPVAANVLDRRFEAAAPRQRWVGDTTEFVIGTSSKLYLAVIPGLVLAVRRRLGGQRRERSQSDPQGAGDGAELRCPAVGLFHHSDQRRPYASEDYQDVLDAHGIVRSMSRRGNCRDNV
jgi:putative transposase